uniref:Uncharacterized protein n=1 Tax=Siphoviridae sp. ctgmM3 TaxID=2827912 RepID=A0A8S5TJX0_9CAUD|nr:MAG TPA: hypothetical protein [Siphoviridae sp. ctgmM3]
MGRTENKNNQSGEQSNKRRIFMHFVFFMLGLISGLFIPRVILVNLIERIKSCDIFSIVLFLFFPIVLGGVVFFRRLTYKGKQPNINQFDISTDYAIYRNNLSEGYSKWKENFQKKFFNTSNNNQNEIIDFSSVLRNHLRHFQETSDLTSNLLIPATFGLFFASKAVTDAQGICQTLALIVCTLIMMIIVMVDVLNARDKASFLEDCLEVCNEELIAIQNKNDKEIKN